MRVGANEESEIIRCLGEEKTTKYLGVKGELSEVHDAPDMMGAIQLTVKHISINFSKSQWSPCYNSESLRI